MPVAGIKNETGSATGAADCETGVRAMLNSRPNGSCPMPADGRPNATGVRAMLNVGASAGSDAILWSNTPRP